MPETKQCNLCKEELLISNFPKKGRWCKKCVAKKTREWYKNNKERANRTTKEWYQNRSLDERRDYELKKTYGIGIKDYYKMLESQEGKCAICQSVDVGNKTSKYFFVDHDHNTGKVRGLLCKKCNIALGEMRDDPDIVYKAWMYLCFDQGKVELFDENNKRLDIT